ncbi:MAG: L-glyceraldehyde 3-phosphate reductase [Eubacteriales bacterium]|nr:L-glyceraldehyde 3-phosphate reductase [Eubacteriales bacterium]
MDYLPSSKRYDDMKYNYCGRSGLKLPAVSLGLWHNFGGENVFENGRMMMRKAFDLGITHFDLANNYGPPPGSAEENFGRIMKLDFHGYRDDMIISTKAGYTMRPGPYGDWGSRKYLLSSLDASLKRMGLDYVDIFYHHRHDPNTPIEETMSALDQAVRQGKALYAGISNYNPEQTKRAAQVLKSLGTPCIIHQERYSMFDRHAEDGLLDTVGQEGIGMIAFSPLAKGMLTNRYLEGIPADSRAASSSIFLTPEDLTDAVLSKIRALNDLALNRGQTLAQMALAWVLRDKRVTSVLIGTSKPSQVEDCVRAIDKIEFTADELAEIERILK